MGKLNFVETYRKYSEKLRGEEKDLDTAMKKGIGGEFDSMGKMQRDLLIQYGLSPHSYLIDVGCGSGRLANQLQHYINDGNYYGFDVVPDFVEFATGIVEHPNFRFDVKNGFHIPEEDGKVDMLCFFSVFTHILHEETFHYLMEAKRVLKSGGKIVFSFLEFRMGNHWDVFQHNVNSVGAEKPLDMFIGRDGIRAWAHHLGLMIEAIHDGDKPHIKLSEDIIQENGMRYEGYGTMGQSVCVMIKP